MAKRLKAAERRASILAVAKILFADKGYHGVSVDEIAHRLGVSPAVLYRHFPSKEALYRAVVEGMAGSRHTYIEAAINGPDDFPSVLARISKVFAANVAKDPDFLRMEMQSALEGSTATERFIRNRWQAITDFVEYNLQQLNQHRTGHKLNEAVTSLMYQGMLRELLYQKCVIDNERYQSLTIDELVDQAVQLFLAMIGYSETADAL
jgi:AcrR family transcriptional regulator